MRTTIALLVASTLAFASPALATCCGGDKTETKAAGKMQCGKGDVKAEGAGSGTAERSQGSHDGGDMRADKPMADVKKAGGCCCGCCGGKDKG